jgi:hypothetical protein
LLSTKQRMSCRTCMHSVHMFLSFSCPVWQHRILHTTMHGKI